MDDVIKFIESGILEMYVLEQLGPEEKAEVERMASLHEEVRNEIDDISIALEGFAQLHAKEPDPTVQPFLMATIDYMERLKNGEPLSFPPILQPDSQIADYAEWLNRDDMQLKEPLNQVQINIIAAHPSATTAIVWLQHGAPPETHSAEFEKFLIVEGTCDITIENDVHSLRAGDVLIIPLHHSHHVSVTSAQACKIILQRVAA